MISLKPVAKRWVEERSPPTLYNQYPARQPDALCALHAENASKPGGCGHDTRQLWSWR